MSEPKDHMTLIVFSNDLDRAMAAFILATGAASSGMEVTIFFTFWGISLLRKKNFVGGKKKLVERLFGWMLPEGPEDATLSKMNFFGAGTSMMKNLMRKKKMPQLADYLSMARSLDVRLVACTTSMGIMGIRQEELLDNIEYGGVATYLGKARESGVNLFI
ncbi:MAG: DsrE/DsrF/DrsH-like family protein [Candidatus Latescibacterota bacterium]